MQQWPVAKNVKMKMMNEWKMIAGQNKVDCTRA